MNIKRLEKKAFKCFFWVNNRTDYLKKQALIGFKTVFEAIKDRNNKFAIFLRSKSGFKQ